MKITKTVSFVLLVGMLFGILAGCAYDTSKSFSEKFVIGLSWSI